MLLQSNISKPQWNSIFQAWDDSDVVMVSYRKTRRSQGIFICWSHSGNPGVMFVWVWSHLIVSFVHQHGPMTSSMPKPWTLFATGPSVSTSPPTLRVWATATVWSFIARWVLHYCSRQHLLYMDTCLDLDFLCTVSWPNNILIMIIFHSLIVINKPSMWQLFQINWSILTASTCLRPHQFTQPWSTVNYLFHYDFTVKKSTSQGLKYPDLMRNPWRVFNPSLVPASAY